MYGTWMGQFAWTGTTLLWMAASFFFGVGSTSLWFWLRKNNIQVKWFEWLIGAIGVFLLVFMMQNITAAGFEEVTGTIPMFLLVFGVPGLILIALAWRLVSRRITSPGSQQAS